MSDYGDKLYLAVIGSNNVHQMIQRLGITSNPILQVRDGGWLHGYERRFFATSKTWGGAVATLVPGGKVGASFYEIRGNFQISPNSEITLGRGPVQILTENGWMNCNFANLMDCEAVNVGKYALRKLDEYSDVCAFVHNPTYKHLHIVQPPTKKYMASITKSLQERRIKLNQDLSKWYYIDVQPINDHSSSHYRAVVDQHCQFQKWEERVSGKWCKCDRITF